MKYSERQVPHFVELAQKHGFRLEDKWPKGETTASFMGRWATRSLRRLSRGEWRFACADAWAPLHWFANILAWQIERRRGINKDTVGGLIASVFNTDHTRWWWRINDYCFWKMTNGYSWALRAKETTEGR